MAQSKTPQNFWHFSFETTVYLINRMPSRTSHNESPFQHVFKRPPDYSFLRVFGCLCFPYLRPYNPHKIDFRSTPCLFLGYSPFHHGYRCLDLYSYRIYIARHVHFDESSFPHANNHIKPYSPTSNPRVHPIHHGPYLPTVTRFTLTITYTHT